MCTLGVVTIGQSPRVDLVPEMREVLGPDVRIVESGALDGLSLEEVSRLVPGAEDYVLVTRMRDGTPVKIAKRRIVQLMQQRITDAVAAGAELVALLCTGAFPEFECTKPLVLPDQVLGHMVRSVAGKMLVGVVVPDVAQVEQCRVRWQHTGREVHVTYASPYEDTSRLAEAAHELKSVGAELVVLDCMGYDFAAKRLFREVLGVPCILARSALSRVLREMLLPGA